MNKSQAIIFTLLLAGCGARPSYLADNMGLGPSLLQTIATKNFYQLPMSGEVADKKKFWSGDYWANNKGNINLRWNTYDPIGFGLLSPNREESWSWTEDDFAWLSPSEKYDLFTGNYDYPLKADVALKANPEAEYWEGICDGWAPASMNHREPEPKTMTNPDGHKIPFGSADIKALISYYYAYEHQAGTFQEGRRCPRRNGWFNWNRDCREDLNAGTFHLIMTNKIGLERKGFIADLQRYKEVWNHPIMSYRSEVLEFQPVQRNSVPGTAKSVKVKTIVTYVDETAMNTWIPVIGTTNQIISSREYVYKLDLDAVGNILGGDWKSQERPDFLWTREPPQSFVGKLARLRELMND